MKTVKLNCASCGAPIVIPDDVDTVTCSSCHSTMMVDRGEGYVTLKIVEKLANAIKENAYVTQVELKRMQLNQLISMEEMKVNTLQAEIRAVKRRMPANLTTTPELVDLLLQENDIRMHIRELFTDIAHLDPGWEESLDVIRKDRQIVEQAIKFLLPYGADNRIRNRIVKLQEETRRIAASYNALEIRLLKRDLTTLNYPPYHQLTLEEMEELMEKIPGDLSRLAKGEQTEVKVMLQEKLKNTLDKIKANYPRKKVESQAGRLPSLDIIEPYPEAPAALAPMIQKVKNDLGKLSAMPESPEKTHFIKKLALLESTLTSRAKADIPAARAKKKKRRTVVTLSVIGGILAVCVVAFVIISVLTHKDDNPDRKSDGQQNQLAGLVGQDKDTPSQGGSGTFQDYTATVVEVTSSVTYLRDEPDLNAKAFHKVEAGEILQVLVDEGVPNLWYKVATMDGSVTGYLALDWAMPITVNSVNGEAVNTNYSSTLYSFDYSSFNSDWTESTDDDEYAYAKASYVDDWYELDVTSNDNYIYYYANITLDGLADQYGFSLTMDAMELEGNAYYGIQTNTIDGANFDALLISREGYVILVRIRDGFFSVLFDSEVNANPWAVLDPLSVNTLSVSRRMEPGGIMVTYAYAVNGHVFAEVSQSAAGAMGTTMGAVLYLGGTGDHALIRMDDFIVRQ